MDRSANLLARSLFRLLDESQALSSGLWDRGHRRGGLYRRILHSRQWNASGADRTPHEDQSTDLLQPQDKGLTRCGARACHFEHDPLCRWPFLRDGSTPAAEVCAVHGHHRNSGAGRRSAPVAGREVRPVVHEPLGIYIFSDAAHRR